MPTSVTAQEKHDVERVDRSEQGLSEAAQSSFFSKEQLAAIRQQLDESEGTWPDRIAASVEEDYRQLLVDFGVR